MRLISAFMVMAVAIAVLLSIGCGSKDSLFGQPLSETEPIPIADILAQPQQYHGRVVKVEGEIIDECPAGGWFHLKDSTGVIYVNLHPSYFAIPQSVGHRARAEGTVRKEGPQVEVIGKGVELQ